MRALALSLLAVLALVAPRTARAQVGSLVTAKLAGSEAVVRGTDDCDDLVQAAWNTSLQGVACSDLVFWLSEPECAETPPASSDASASRVQTVAQETWSLQNQGAFTFAVKDLPAFKYSSTADGGGIACGAAEERTYRLCAHFQVDASGYANCASKSNAKMLQPPTVTYDGEPPAPPTLEALAELDGALSVSFTAPSCSRKSRSTSPRRGARRSTSFGRSAIPRPTSVPRRAAARPPSPRRRRGR
jgi:hypothetical protein